jgi:hypothetical protein
MKKILRLIFLVFIGIAVTATAMAVNINVTIPGSETASSTNPCTTVVNFYWFALLISGILAFGAIVYGGIKYALASGNPSGQSEGKEWIMGALWGILLLAGAYLILNVVNPELTKCELPQLSQLQTSNSTSDQSCQNQFGPNSIWLGKTLPGDTFPTGCICKDGYKWNTDGTTCIVK